MKVTREGSWCKVEYEDTQEIRDAVFNKVVDWFFENDCFIGETLQQDDTCLLDAPNVLSDICDDIFKFNVIDIDE